MLSRTSSISVQYLFIHVQASSHSRFCTSLDWMKYGPMNLSILVAAIVQELEIFQYNVDFYVLWDLVPIFLFSISESSTCWLAAKMAFSLSRSLSRLTILRFLIIALPILSFYLQVNDADLGTHTRLLSQVSYSSTPSKRPPIDRPQTTLYHRGASDIRDTRGSVRVYQAKSTQNAHCDGAVDKVTWGSNMLLSWLRRYQWG